MSEALHNYEDQPVDYTQRFIDAVASVENYNDKHTGWGHIIGRAITDTIGERDPLPYEPDVSDIERAGFEKELVTMLQKDELESMGITLYQAEDGTMKPFDDDGNLEDEAPDALIMLITDREQFEETLFSLNPTEEQKRAVGLCIDALFSTTIALIQAAHREYEPPEGTDPEWVDEATQETIKDQIELFLSLSPAINSIGFDYIGSYRKLTNYAYHYSAGTLADYRIAEREGWTEGSPALWQRNANPEYLRVRWTDIFDYLSDLRDRKEPSNYFTKIFTKLRADFQVSMEWLEADEFADLRRSYSDECIEGLKTEMNELAEIWKEKFPLENAFYLAETQEEQ